MKTIDIDTSRKYSVLLGNKLLKESGELSVDLLNGKNVMIVTDDIVATLYLKQVVASFSYCGFEVNTFIIKNGEQSKNKDTLFAILEKLAQLRFNRNDTLISLGGGVCGDIVGLAASIYCRGIKYIQIPTTLLSMVDASIGGKTAIDLKEGKNLIGTFYQPSLVISDIDTLKTLSNDNILEGIGEMIKYDIIKNIGLCDLILSDSLESNLQSSIEKCIDIKKELVELDEFETKGKRQLLNAGHTFAHAIEKCSNYNVPHGIAVAIGLYHESQISYKLGKCDKSVCETLERALKKLDIDFTLKFDKNKLADAMVNDKKNKDGLICFVLPLSFGKCELCYLDYDKVIDLVNSL